MPAYSPSQVFFNAILRTNTFSYFHIFSCIEKALKKPYPVTGFRSRIFHRQTEGIQGNLFTVLVWSLEKEFMA